jgi:hypothetical protein
VPSSLAALERDALPMLRRRFGEESRLLYAAVIRHGHRNLVAWCELRRDGEPPVALILKQIEHDPERGRADWASLLFLNSLPATRGLVPTLIAGDVEAGVHALADLGGWRSLDDLLREPDGADVVEQALAELGALYGRLHATTVGQQAALAAAAALVPGAGLADREAEAARWLGGEERWREWSRRAGVALPTGWADAVRAVARAYAEPGAFLTFTHGDPAPTNNHVAPDGALTLLDFEYGGYRHALYDVTAWNVLCPLPLPLVRIVREAHERTFLPHRPTLRPEDYARQWGLLTAYRALAMLAWIGADALDADSEWVEPWTRRATVLTTVTRLAAAAAETPAVEPLSEWGAALHRRLAPVWGITDALPPWPALRPATAPHPLGAG